MTLVLNMTNFSDLKTFNATQRSDEITISKILGKAKFPVFLGNISTANKNVAVKMFPFHLNNSNICFQNEIRFTHLKHENVISILHHEAERKITYDGLLNKVSYTVMELAPHGDFFDFITSGKVKMNDKLARTYFHQLIAGIEYLHSVGVVHTDLKCENLLLGEDYKLKIGDFDQAFMKGQSEILGRGTVNYRAPELAQRKCKNPKAVDIYSAGIVLFTMKCGGFIPYVEETEKGLDVLHLMRNCPKMFWKKHSNLQGSIFDDDFKTLFMGMVAFKPEERMSIQQIKESKWYKQPVYTQEELEAFLKPTYN